MRFIIATLTALATMSAALIVEDPFIGKDDQGRDIPLDVSRSGHTVRWSDVQPGQTKVWLFLANWTPGHYPSECIPIPNAQGIDASRGQFTIGPGGFNCPIVGGSGYTFRVMDHNDCCHFTGFENPKHFPVAPFTPISAPTCRNPTCS